MKRFLTKLILLLAAFVTLLCIEMIYTKDVNPIETVSVYVAKEKIKPGTQLLDYMIESVMIPKHLASEYIVTDHITGFMLTTVEPGEFLYKHQLSDSSPIQLQEHERMITVKCNIVEGNGWLFKINEKVDVVMVTDDDKIVIKDASICRIFDENISDELLPTYISLIVDESASLIYFTNLSRSEVFLSKK